jgi:hypothetical protein
MIALGEWLERSLARPPAHPSSCATVSGVSSDRKWEWLERLKTALEIVAIIGASIWAYTRYVADEAPSFATRIDLHGRLEWNGFTPERCLAEYEIELQNLSLRPLDVSRTRFSVWKLETAAFAKSDRVALLDPIALAQGPPVLDQDSDKFNGRYQAEERSAEAFSFIIPRSLGQYALFKAEFWEINNRTAEPDWVDYRWDLVCPEQPGPDKEPPPLKPRARD